MYNLLKFFNFFQELPFSKIEFTVAHSSLALRIQYFESLMMLIRDSLHLYFNYDYFWAQLLYLLALIYTVSSIKMHDHHCYEFKYM